MELECTHTAKCLTVPIDSYPELKRLAADLRHSKKLMRDLPIALANSKSALKKAVASDERDFTELGVMTYEQHRLESEIAEQQKKAAAIQKQIDSCLRARKEYMWWASPLYLNWNDHYEIEGAAVVAFESMQSYARSVAHVPAQLIKKLTKGVKRKCADEDENEDADSSL